MGGGISVILNFEFLRINLLFYAIYKHTFKPKLAGACGPGCPAPGGAFAPAEFSGSAPGGALAPATFSGPAPSGAFAPAKLSGSAPGSALPGLTPPIATPV